MSLTVAYSLLLVLSLILLAAQLLVRQKQAIHVLFACFCGSMAMVAANELGNGHMGYYQYLVAMGTCGTCNVFWLIARALFRGRGGVNATHILAAGSVSIMLITVHGLNWANVVYPAYSDIILSTKSAIGELLTLTSSTMLMLSLWEGVRGLGQADAASRRQRYLFLGSFCTALFLSSVLSAWLTGLYPESGIHAWLVAFSALNIMLATQTIIIWQGKNASARSETVSDAVAAPPQTHEPCDIAHTIKHIIKDEALFLQANLRVGDVAQRLNQPEYRISRALQQIAPGQNFNQYINTFRVAHARTLLEQPHNNHWPIIVIGLESGFASVGPFTRAFKQAYGSPPGQYRADFMNGKYSAPVERANARVSTAG